MSRFLQSLTGPRYLPVFPDSWPRNTGRTKPFQEVPGDVLYTFADVEGAPAGTMSITDISVTVADGTVLVLLPGHGRVPFAEFFGYFLTVAVINGWRSLTRDPHTPRVSVGGVTVLRESWRVDVRAAQFLQVKGELDSYRATQSWRHSLGLPDTVYASLSGETKPFYVDFRAPVSVLSFLVAARASLRGRKGSGEMTISEALPRPEEAWVVDARGNEYLGEIRIMLVDGRALGSSGGTVGR
jgi:hypothetical protein